MEETDMNSDAQLNNLVGLLVDLAYPELRMSDIKAMWSSTNCFATISWNQNLESIRIRCNRTTKKWHEAALLGLLSHELSHTVQKQSKNAEMKADLDAIKRGMGIYLAIERIFADKYEDHVIKRGRDRYLGYSSIRAYLFKTELEQLDRLLVEMKFVPKKQVSTLNEYHDMQLMRDGKSTSIYVDGHEFTIPQEIKDADVKIVDDLCHSKIYVGKTLLGEIDKTH